MHGRINNNNYFVKQHICIKLGVLYNNEYENHDNKKSFNTMVRKSNTYYSWTTITFFSYYLEVTDRM